MFGQFFEPLGIFAPGGWFPCAGAVVVLVPVDGADDDVVDAAFAIAAPPPASAPVTTRVVSRGLIRCRILLHLLRFDSPDDPDGPSEPRRRHIRVS
jgi:hypothetical protein